jgi:hypothetical protein
MTSPAEAGREVDRMAVDRIETAVVARKATRFMVRNLLTG